MSKEAMKLALEALKEGDWYIEQLENIVYSPDDDGIHENRAKVQETIKALEEALKQEQDEPVAWRIRWTDGSVSYREEEPSDACKSECEVKALYIKE